jgi:hypothetical protein
MHFDNAPSRPARKLWRVAALGAAIVAVVLCAIFAAPLVLDFSYFAPHNLTATLAQALTAQPSQGATEEEITLTGTGLTPNSEVSILGGIDQAQLQPLGTGRADGSGKLDTLIKIPEWAERGRQFYFATQEDGKRVGLASVNVIVRTDVGPIGVGGSPPATQ